MKSANKHSSTTTARKTSVWRSRRSDGKGSPASTWSIYFSIARRLCSLPYEMTIARPAPRRLWRSRLDAWEHELSDYPSRILGNRAPAPETSGFHQTANDVLDDIRPQPRAQSRWKLGPQKGQQHFIKCLFIGRRFVESPFSFTPFNQTSFHRGSSLQMPFIRTVYEIPVDLIPLNKTPVMRTWFYESLPNWTLLN